VKAYAKLNLCLYVGHPRADGYHPLVSVFQSVQLADEVTFEPAERDEVVCAGVAGPNLAARALAAARRAGWGAGPVRVVIDKQIPVAAGLGGGSADAAAVLRHTGVDDPEVALALGADVPFQLRTGRALVTGIGEHLEPLPPGPEQAFVILPSRHELSTPAVYKEADRLGLTRDLDGVDITQPVNDLQDAARSLCPEIDERLAALGPGAMVAGSGPTVFRSFDDAGEARGVAERILGAILTHPLTERR
jgi:4-diphosphocytidyl-2-C-methyl-D-erythritol kinase